MKKARLCLWLFGVNLLISAFAFGGGYVVVPMIRKYFVTRRQCFTEDDLLGMAAVGQSAPGAIAMNLAALAGYRGAGVAGSVVSCLAGVLPALLRLSLISLFYTAFCENVVIAAILRGMQAGVAALIVDVVVDMCRAVLKERSRLLTMMVPAAFAASFLFHVPVALVLLACCLLCAGRVWWRKRRGMGG